MDAHARVQKNKESEEIKELWKVQDDPLQSLFQHTERGETQIRSQL